MASTVRNRPENMVGVGLERVFNAKPRTEHARLWVDFFDFQSWSEKVESLFSVPGLKVKRWMLWSCLYRVHSQTQKMVTAWYHEGHSKGTMGSEKLPKVGDSWVRHKQLIQQSKAERTVCAKTQRRKMTVEEQPVGFFQGWLFGMILLGRHSKLLKWMPIKIWGY